MKTQNGFLYAIYNHELLLLRTFILKKRSRRFVNDSKIYIKGVWVVDTQFSSSQTQSLKRAA